MDTDRKDKGMQDMVWAEFARVMTILYGPGGDENSSWSMLRAGVDECRTIGCEITCDRDSRYGFCEDCWEYFHKRSRSA